MQDAHTRRGNAISIERRGGGDVDVRGRARAWRRPPQHAPSGGTAVMCPGLNCRMASAPHRAGVGRAQAGAAPSPGHIQRYMCRLESIPCTAGKQPCDCPRLSEGNGWRRDGGLFTVASGWGLKQSSKGMGGVIVLGGHPRGSSDSPIKRSRRPHNPALARLAKAVKAARLRAGGKLVSHAANSGCATQRRTGRVGVRRGAATCCRRSIGSCS